MAENGQETRRERKQVEFFAPTQVKKDGEKLIIKQGKGSKLRDIPNVLFNLITIKAKEVVLEDLHQLMYRRKGKAATRKTEIREFSGFAYPVENRDVEMAKDLAKLNSFKLEVLHQMMDLLDIPRGTGDKDSKAAKIWEFLDEPKVLSTVDKAAKAAQKREKVMKKREKGKKRKTGKAGKTADEGEEDGDDDDADAAEEQEEAPKKKVAKKSAPAKRKPAAKEDKPRKRQKKAGTKAAEEEDDDDEAMDAPLGEVARIPNDAQLEEDALAVLGTVDVQLFSLRGLLGQLEEKYGVSAGLLGKLKKKKELVKRTAILYAAQKPVEADEDEEGREEEPEVGEEDEAAAAEEAAFAVEEEDVDEEAEDAADAEEGGEDRNGGERGEEGGTDEEEVAEAKEAPGEEDEEA